MEGRSSVGKNRLNVWLSTGRERDEGVGVRRVEFDELVSFWAWGR